MSTDAVAPKADPVTRQTERYQALLKDLGSTLDNDHVREEKRAARNRRWDNWFRLSTALLGVVAPALVTFQTTRAGNSYWALAAVLVTGLVGAIATLQAAFRWNERYCQSQISAFALDELRGHVRETLDLAETMDGPIDCMTRLQNELTTASSERRRILRQLMEQEVNLVKQVSERQAQLPNPA
jgi:membrane protein YdbS with pleckstrin-like domain